MKYEIITALFGALKNISCCYRATFAMSPRLGWELVAHKNVKMSHVPSCSVTLCLHFYKSASRSFFMSWLVKLESCRLATTPNVVQNLSEQTFIKMFCSLAKIKFQIKLYSAHHLSGELPSIM